MYVLIVWLGVNKLLKCRMSRIRELGMTSFTAKGAGIKSGFIRKLVE
jgi:hypothetical protein